MKRTQFIFIIVLGLLRPGASNLLRADSFVVNPTEEIKFQGSDSAGTDQYEVKGGETTLVPAGPTYSSYLLRSEGGKVSFFDSTSAASATFVVDGGPGNGGRWGWVQFNGNSTAASADITNKGGVLGPNFAELSPPLVYGFGGTTSFYDTARAGTARVTNEGSLGVFSATPFTTTPGNTGFGDNSSADRATFMNSGASVVYGLGGITFFTGNATADNGVFTNFGGAVSSDYSNGRTIFYDNATAANGTFTNKGGNGGFIVTGGATEFRGSSNAGSGTFINEGGVNGTYPKRGTTQFFEAASAGNGTFINQTGPNGGGAVEFNGNSTAANGTFINSGSSQPGVSGGEFLFKGDSTAGEARFTTSGQQGGYVTFTDRASAGRGTFMTDPDLYNSRIMFRDSSTAGNGTFDVGGGSALQFFESATAGNATITLRGNGTAGGNPITGGATGGFSGGTGGNATIIVMGAEGDGKIGASLYFSGSATAGNAAITANGASATTFGAYGGNVWFDYSASAGTATLIANDGTNGGAGGTISFSRGATADQARVILNAGATLDVAGNALSGGTPVGSVEGAGNIHLGRSLLTVGLLNSSTIFSGVISDDSNPFYAAGGQLTKAGTGQLTLAGANTYTGLTTVADGILSVNGSIFGDVQVNSGGTLKGVGTIGGTVSVAAGGTFSPGNSPGTITVGNLVLGPGSIAEFELGTFSDLVIVNGDLALGGILNIVDSGGFAPHGLYDLFHWTGLFTNLGFTIGDVPNGYSASDFGFDFSGDTLRLSVSDVVPPPPIEPQLTTPVPEPSTYGLFGAFGLAVIILKRRFKC